MVQVGRRSTKNAVAVSAFLIGASFLAAQAETLPKFTMQGPAEKSNEAVPKDPLGHPCLDVEAAARAQIVNPEMLDHVVSIKNNCSRLIKVKICYYNSNYCRDVDMMGYKRVDTVLGSMRGTNFFRYSIQQR